MVTRRRRLIIEATLAMVVTPVAALAALSIFGRQSDQLGARDGRLAPCPDTTNCVSSQTRDPRHAIDPIRFTGTAEAALDRLRCVLAETPRTRIVSADDHYVRAESHTRFFRFVDDLEFLVDRAQSVIHVRSASRVGHSDFGKNRDRIEGIRAAFERLTRSS